jgi:hypothetical protein
MNAEPRPVRPAMPPVIPGNCDTGHPVCGAEARLYAAGWRCVQHTPAALASRPEAPEPIIKEIQ